MEIAITRKGELRIVSIKGNLRLQHWRVIDKHMDSLLGNGSRWVVLDLCGATLIGMEGIDSLSRSVRKFREHDANLMLFSDAPGLLETLRSSGGEAGSEGVLFADWRDLEASLLGRGLAAGSMNFRPWAAPESRRS